jgi:hypothetical protein
MDLNVWERSKVNAGSEKNLEGICGEWDERGEVFRAPWICGEKDERGGVLRTLGYGQPLAYGKSY